MAYSYKYLPEFPQTLIWVSNPAPYILENNDCLKDSIQYINANTTYFNSLSAPFVQLLKDTKASIAEAYVVFSGRVPATTGTLTLSSSYNVISATKTGVGRYTITFPSTAFSSANYCVVGTANLVVGTSYSVAVGVSAQSQNTLSITTNAFLAGATNNNFFDSATVSVLVYGN